MIDQVLRSNNLIEPWSIWGKKVASDKPMLVKYEQCVLYNPTFATSVVVKLVFRNFEVDFLTSPKNIRFLSLMIVQCLNFLP